MAVDPDLFASFDTALGTAARLAARDAQAAFEDAGRVAGQHGGDDLALLASLVAALVVVKNRYGDAAMQSAREFYARQRELAGVAGAFGEYEPEFAQQVPDAFVAHDLADAVATQRRADPKGQLDFDALCESMRGHMMEYPVKASDWTMTRNARRDPAHPKWAFVPHVGACPWCCFVGTKGFTFNSESGAAAERHAHCTCPVVVDFDVDSPHLDGYDPDGMYQRLLECGDAVGSYDWADALREASGRDREWLRSGAIPKIELEKRWDDLEPHEQAGIKKLASNGIVMRVPVEDPAAKANIDLVINGQDWELKNVTNAKSSVSNQVKRARVKWMKLERPDPMKAIFTTEGLAPDVSPNEVEREIAKRLRRGEEAVLVYSTTANITRIRA